MKYLFICFTALSLSFALNANPFKGQHKGPGGMMIKMIKKLDLDKEQKSQLKEIKKSNRKEMKMLFKELGKEKRELHKNMMSDVSEDELRSQFAKIQEKANQLHSKKFEISLKIRSILTVEQRKELREMIKSKIKKRYDKAMETFE